MDEVTPQKVDGREYANRGREILVQEVGKREGVNDKDVHCE